MSTTPMTPITEIPQVAHPDTIAIVNISETFQSPEDVDVKGYASSLDSIIAQTVMEYFPRSRSTPGFLLSDIDSKMIHSGKLDISLLRRDEAGLSAGAFRFITRYMLNLVDSKGGKL